MKRQILTQVRFFNAGFFILNIYIFNVAIITVKVKNIVIMQHKLDFVTNARTNSLMCAIQYMHAWNQQVVCVIFKKTSLQHLAGASRLSSPRQLPMMVISYSFFSNAHAQTHARLHNHSCNSCTSTFAHVHTPRLFLFSLSLFFDNTTSSLTSSRSAPLSVLQQESLL